MHEDPHVREELGDVLFTVVNLARKLNIDAEGAMRDANAKFDRRFRYMEQYALASGPRTRRHDARRTRRPLASRENRRVTNVITFVRTWHASRETTAKVTKIGNSMGLILPTDVTGSHECHGG